MTPFPQHPVLLVDDDPDTLKGFQIILEKIGINNFILCQDSQTVMPVLGEHGIEVVLLDLIMPKISGEDLLTMISAEYPDLPVIVITGDTDIQLAVRCMKKGAFDYMIKPVEQSRLISGVKRAIEMRRLQNENQALKERILSGQLKNPEAFREINTQNRSMIGLFQYAESIVASPQPVLITGETGVGKELIARALHHLSSRKGRLIAVNAAGIDDNTFSDTLFGHISGAFTGGEKPRQGMVEHATGGTLFLDEIGDLSPISQVKLLRLLQEREYFPLGADMPKIADIRVIVATNKDLRPMQETGKFRKDLYYRLCFHHLKVPPLRERLDDLPLLIHYFLETAAREMGKKKPVPPPELFHLLANYYFPGNVRELKSMIYDAVADHKSRVLSLERFKTHISQSLPSPGLLSGYLPEEKSYYSDLKLLPTVKEAIYSLVVEAMKRSGNNKSMAARFLGISRQRLGRYLTQRIL
ncbi:sigma-54 dependent transcriptional regulator [uncultured Desulfobacter sp.]|uniref:sigma-54-dependent transcriptional regulator n=1 Tax=uncultured Desulfobacter sp. TaxID=240139 RepID=UPI002AABAAEA|nr:sigma-54 dependent transcriptional regulator [uncultured Desulfobacter sp.]